MNDLITCPKCQSEKSASDFYPSTKRKNGLYGYCKECFNTYNDARRLELKEKSIRYKGSQCVKCKLSFPSEPACIFDFHHLNRDEKGEWTSIRKLSWERIRVELDKCVLLCSNCHRKVEFFQEKL